MAQGRGLRVSALFVFWNLFCVDIRLQDLASGLRGRRIRSSDLPEVSRAVLSVVRGVARAEASRSLGLRYVRLVGQGLDVEVLREDWKKIQPFILDGTFDPGQFPVPRKGSLHRSVDYDPAVIDVRDRTLFERILSTLSRVFEEDYPIQ